MLRTISKTVVIISFTSTLGIGCGGSGNNSSDPNGPTAQIARANCDFIASGQGPSGVAPVHANKWITGLQTPWSLAFLPGGDALVTERGGTLRLIQGGALVTAPVMTVQVGTGGEQGLLGLALDPGFATNSRFFVYNTVAENGINTNRVDRYILSEGHTSATFDRTIVDGIPAGTVHNGGRLKFGPDGNLYVGTGESKNGPLAQDPGSKGGKILRVTADGGIPGGNPVAGNPYWAMGVRNVQAFDWVNPQTMIVAEHGPTGEINGWTGHDRVEFVGGGENFGWPNTYGCGGDGYATPALAFNDATPPGGGLLYTGSAIPEWTGSFIVGTLGSTLLERFVIQSNPYGVSSNETYFTGTYGRLRDVVQGPDGNIYVTTSNCDSRGSCPSDQDYILQVVHN
jgi:glucose/arabinose dehydrogenase